MHNYLRWCLDSFLSEGLSAEFREGPLFYLFSQNLSLFFRSRAEHLHSPVVNLPELRHQSWATFKDRQLFLERGGTRNTVYNLFIIVVIILNFSKLKPLLPLCLLPKSGECCTENIHRFRDSVGVLWCHPYEFPECSSPSCWNQAYHLFVVSLNRNRHYVQRMNLTEGVEGSCEQGRRWSKH